jgi:5-methyltetrahydrofolate--homocysteine methyltransferase
MGTNLFARGLETGDSPELWNVERPAAITEVHTAFIDAGADIILTNSFGCNALRLKLHNLQDRVTELNVAAAQLARKAADASGRRVLVAGSMGPTGEIFEPVGSLSIEEGKAALREQATALAQGGVDILWVETMSSVEEVTAAVETASETGLPVVATMSFDTNGRTMMGLTPDAALALAHAMPAPPAGFGANCGIGPAQLLATILGFSRLETPDDIIVAKGNCGIPEYREGHIHYSGTVEVMINYATLAQDAGARIIGGCCGTTPEHLAAMAKALEGRHRGPVPDIADIEQRLGPITIVKDAPEPRRRTRRRPAS